MTAEAHTDVAASQSGCGDDNEPSKASPPVLASAPSAEEARGTLPSSSSWLTWAVREGVIIAMLLAVAIMVLKPLVFDKVHPDRLMLTPQQLSLYDGVRHRKVFLAVMGTVFDVTAGSRHYGPNGSYRGAAGRDASRAFSTGEFERDAVDNISDLPAEQAAAVHRWREFFANHKEYRRKGRVVGSWYDANGDPTEELRRVEAIAAKAAADQKDKAAAKAEEVVCNTQWSARDGKTLWCPESKGFPRKVKGSTSECVCVPTVTATNTLQLFPGCAPTARKCHFDTD